MPDRAASWERFLPFVVALAFGFVTLDGGFVGDDGAAIATNPLVDGSLPASEAFLRDFWGRRRIFVEAVDTYRPLIVLVFRCVARAFGVTPLPFRVASLLAHGAAVLSGMALLRRLGLPARQVLLASLFFAVHAGHAECSGSLVAMADVLGFVVGAWSTSLLVAPASRSRVALSAVALLVACGLKESAFVFGCASLAVVALRAGSDRRAALAATGAVLAGVVALQAAIPRAVDARYGTTLASDAHGLDRLLLGLAFVGRGMSVAIVPTGMAFRHSYAAYDLSFATLAPLASLGAAGTAVLAAVFVSGVRRRATGVVALTVLAAGPLLLNSSLLAVVPNEVPERTLYPTFFAASVLLASVVGRLANRRAASAIAVTITMLSSGQRIVHQRPYRSDEALFLHSVAEEPRSAELRVAAGGVHARRGEVSAAAWDYAVASFVAGHRPGPLDFAKVEELETLPVDARFLLAPELLSTSERCRYVQGFLRVYAEHLPVASGPARDLWSRRYAACFPGPAATRVPTTGPRR